MIIENNTQSLYSFQNITINQNSKSEEQAHDKTVSNDKSLEVTNVVDRQVNGLLKNEVPLMSTNDILDIHTTLDKNKDTETSQQNEVGASSSSSEITDRLEELYERLAQVQKQIAALMNKLEGASDEQKMLLNDQISALNNQMVTILSQIMVILKSEEDRPPPFLKDVKQI
jgi:DNA-binding transcriptional MerR regulator